MPAALVHELIAAHSAARPNETVIIDGGIELSRSNLWDASTSHACQLLHSGVRPGSRVVLHLPPGASFSLAALSVLRIGAAYVPADAAAEQDALYRLLEATDPAAWVTTADRVSTIPAGVPIVPAHEFNRPTTGASRRDCDEVARITAGIRPTDEVYRIFTSGTTGTPKGVMIPHQALADFLSWEGEVLALRAADRMLQRSRLAFDLSVTELWLPLTHGGALVYCPEAIRSAPSELLRFIRDGGITVAQFVPTVLEAVMAAAIRDPNHVAGSNLRAVVCNGEPLSDLTRRRFYGVWKNATLWNQYGPAEATVAVTSKECPRSDEPEVMTVGAPMGGNRVVVLDASLAPVPIGDAGEVCIAGSQLALGYAGSSPAEEARFAMDNRSSERVYRTGDLGRFTNWGELELLGRLDHQAKFRGIRIELEAVERTIEAFDGVRRAAVRVHSFNGLDGRRRQVLIALVTPADIDTEKLKAHCRERLPTHAIPGLVVPVDEFRVTPNGKLDFAAHLRQDAEELVTDTCGHEREDREAESAVVMVIESLFGVSIVGEPGCVELNSLGIDSLDRAELVVALEARGLLVDVEDLVKPSITLRDFALACRTIPEPLDVRTAATLTVADVLEAVRAAAQGCSSGVLVMHVSLPTLLAAGDSIRVPTLRRALVDELMCLANAGVMVVLPAFTPSFVNSRSYHFERSVSEAGLLATWVQDDIEGAVRSHDPVYSYVVLGGSLPDFPFRASPTPFGAGSVAAWLEAYDATIVGLGTRGFTQTHRIEFLAGAPHHADYEVFEGVADFGSGPQYVSPTVYIRDVDYHGAGEAFAQDTATTESLLAGILRTSPIGSSSVRVHELTCLELRRALLPVLRSDPLALLATPDVAMGRLSEVARSRRHEQR